MPAGSGVFMLLDTPEQHFARFRCKVCGKRFTRSYDGSLRTKPRRPSLCTGEAHTLLKSQAEIACLVEMGLGGECNRQIACKLGWGEKTVRIYWIALGLEDQVHQAQTRRRTEEKLERYAALRSQIRAVVDSILAQDREVTLQQVSRALGNSGDYWLMCCDQIDLVREELRQHNVRVRLQRDEAVSTQIARSLESLQSCGLIVKFEEIAKQAGISSNQLRDHYPELRLRIHDVIQEHCTRLKQIRIKKQIKQMDAAARRLIAQGHRLNYKAILNAAGLSPYADKSVPIRDALMRWVSNFAPYD